MTMTDSLGRYLRNNRGNATLMAIAALLMLTVLASALVTTAMSSLTIAKRQSLNARALQVAEAGVERAISWLRGAPAPDGTTDGSFRNHVGESGDNHSQCNWYAEQLSANESFKVCIRDAPGVSGRVIIRSESYVTYGSASASRIIEVVAERRVENVSCWNNVIFAGVGQAGHSIDGNVVMRGSVHLLGDGESFTDLDGDGHWDDDEPYTDSNKNGHYDLGEPYTDVDGDGHRDSREPFIDANGNGVRDPALEITDLAEEISGTADIGNNYNGMPSDLLAKIPSCPTTTFAGETVQSLSAKLRVKHGQVSISGSAVAGYPQQIGNSVKETLDGAYVTDGYTGNKGASSVYADNGTSASYDLGDGVVTFPTLQDPFPPYGTYQDYLYSTSTVVNSSLTLSSSNYSVSGPNGSLTYTASTGLLVITGKVYFTGDVNINASKIIYRGKGTIISAGDININCDVLPETRFPTTDALGWIAAKNMTVGNSAQLTLAGAFYAQYKVYIPKQSNIAGSLVSSYFSVKNVPHIYQVPALATSLPPGMPGSDPIWIVTVDIKSWRDLGGYSN
jgi:type II secretory pathway pseudopilin PulG